MSLAPSTRLHLSMRPALQIARWRLGCSLAPLTFSPRTNDDFTTDQSKTSRFLRVSALRPLFWPCAEPSIPCRWDYLLTKSKTQHRVSLVKSADFLPVQNVVLAKGVASSAAPGLKRVHRHHDRLVRASGERVLQPAEG